MDIPNTWTAVYTATTNETKTIKNESYANIRIEKGTVVPTDSDAGNRLEKGEWKEGFTLVAGESIFAYTETKDKIGELSISNFNSGRGTGGNGGTSLVLGETTGTAYEGSKGKSNADNIALLIAEVNTLKTQMSSQNLRIQTLEQLSAINDYTCQEYLNLNSTPVSTSPQPSPLSFARDTISKSDATKVIVGIGIVTFVTAKEHKIAGSVTVTNTSNTDITFTLKAQDPATLSVFKTGTATIPKRTGGEGTSFTLTVPFSSTAMLTTAAANQNINFVAMASATGLTLQSGQITILE